MFYILLLIWVQDTRGHKLLSKIFFCFISPILYPKADNFFMSFVIPQFCEESLAT